MLSVGWRTADLMFSVSNIPSCEMSLSDFPVNVQMYKSLVSILGQRRRAHNIFISFIHSFRFTMHTYVYIYILFHSIFNNAIPLKITNISWYLFSLHWIDWLKELLTKQELGNKKTIIYVYIHAQLHIEWILIIITIIWKRITKQATS